MCDSGMIPRKLSVSIVTQNAKLTKILKLYACFLNKGCHWLRSWVLPDIAAPNACKLIPSIETYLWPCITKPTKSRMAQFCVMARNRWSGSAWVIFWFWYILKEQSFFYIILKFGSIKRIISRVFCCFSRPIFLRSDGSCDHSTCPIISL